MQNRAYSMLEVKSFDGDLRVFKGVATTPTPDRMGDVIEPLGVKFTNPMPLLWQHKHDKPIGQVIFKQPTEKGIEFEAKIARSDTPGPFKERLDEAWESIKLGLTPAVSIGFKPKEYNFMKDSDGIHFVETEVMELSLVTIPANAEATISAFKSLDAEALAASGRKNDPRLERPVRPGVTGQPRKATSTKLELKMPKTIDDQIAGAEAKRAATAAAIDAIMAKAAEEGRVLEEDEEKTYDEHKLTIQNLDNHLVRLRDHAEIIKATPPKPAGQENPVNPPSTGMVVREHQQHLQNGATRVPRVQIMKPKVEDWQPFTRYIQAVAYGKGNMQEAREWAQRQSWANDHTPEVIEMLKYNPRDLAFQLQQRTVIGVGTTTDTNFASGLIAYTVAAEAFAQYLRPATILGRIPGLRNVPFNIQVPRMTTGAAVGWVGENAPKPVTSEVFDTITLRWAKAAAIIALTQELLRFSNPQIEGLVRDDLRNAMAEFLDRQFVDPSVAAVTNVSPASITNGVSAVTPTGTTASAFRADVKTLLTPIISANIPLDSGVWIMHTSQAVSLSLMQNSLGQPVFPSITRTGGTLLGFPVIATTNVPAAGGSPADGYVLIFAVANEILLADDGVTLIDASDQASLQMDTAPDSPPSASSPYVSLWQMNWVGLRVERWITWLKRRSQAVQYMQGAKYAE